MKLAVITARGGSKRIPRKNIKEFCGKPMIAWSIEEAKASGIFDLIIVSTDDDEIANIAKLCGAEVPFKRPAELADDFAGTGVVVKHAVEWFLNNELTPEFVCAIYPTAPFIQSSDILKGFDLLVSGQADMAFSVTSFPYPVQRALRVSEMGSVEMVLPQYRSTRSQELEELYHDAGQFYWYTLDAILKQLPMFSAHSIPVVLPRHRVQDIDTLEDWRRAELMFKCLCEES